MMKTLNVLLIFMGVIFFSIQCAQNCVKLCVKNNKKSQGVSLSRKHTIGLHLLYLCGIFGAYLRCGVSI